MAPFQKRWTLLRMFPDPLREVAALGKLEDAQTLHNAFSI